MTVCPDEGVERRWSWRARAYGQIVREHVFVKFRSSTSRENGAGDPGEEREVRASKALPTSRADRSIEHTKKYPNEPF